MSQTARDDLARILSQLPADEYTAKPDRSPVKYFSLKQADQILAAGYSKPRTLTDVNDLATVYAGAIIRDADGQMWGIDGATDNLFAIPDGIGEPYSDHDVIMPAVVIYEGPVS